MANQLDPMEKLRQRLNRLRNNRDANTARIQAALLPAIIDGADRDKVEDMARAVLLNLDDDA